jgi:hypothetical protein
LRLRKVTSILVCRLTDNSKKKRVNILHSKNDKKMLAMHEFFISVLLIGVLGGKRYQQSMVSLQDGIETLFLEGASCFPPFLTASKMSMSLTV